MKKEKIPNEIRTDALLRGTSSNYIRLISDADRKARIMIVVNSILLTVGVTWLTKIFHQGRPTWVPLILLVISNLLSLFFTILSVKPYLRISGGKDTEDNILHYKKCSEYSMREYEAHMMNTMNNNDKKLEAVIKELHYFGNLLNRQYRFLKMAYTCFYWGLVLTVVSYIIILLLYPGVKESIQIP
ncbi:MAG TPA: Pycsar system effector family protein [Chitinophagaceae bacterium]|nr:Pycsar system effector family protein [Chitinophagaceae bacterium]